MLVPLTGFRIKHVTPRKNFLLNKLKATENGQRKFDVVAKTAKRKKILETKHTKKLLLRIILTLCLIIITPHVKSKAPLV